MRALGIIVVIGVMSLTAGKAMAAGTLRTMDEVGAAIRACWNAPSGPQGAFVTMSFSFRRDGRLLGPPRLAAIDVPGDAEARQRFADSAIAALEHCTPLPLAPALADNIDGQVFTMRFFGVKE
jgi:hypothetical protein